jgi:multidrug efflux pump subunit AcrA (membrane-fusion protein)
MDLFGTKAKAQLEAAEAKAAEALKAAEARAVEAEAQANALRQSANELSARVSEFEELAGEVLKRNIPTKDVKNRLRQLVPDPKNA